MTLSQPTAKPAEDYNPKQLEADAQAYWDTHQSFAAKLQTEHANASPKTFYCLAMFPYPSGKLHMGHVRNYTLADVIARFQRMQGKQVLQPMGWDAFGLPAENAALQHNTDPNSWTQSNIKDMRAQLKSLGFAYDWQREIATCHPDYYLWEQWFFIQLYEKGLVYKKKAVVNWDPVDQTVLANEQVIEGKGWRSGAPIERKEIPQWFLKITDYAEELLADLQQLDQWPHQVRTMQENWIGKSIGVSIDFPIDDSNIPLEGFNIPLEGSDITEASLTENESTTVINVYTTRPDTLMGVTYLALAPKHPLSLKLSENNPKLKSFINSCQQIKVAEADMATLEKKGMPLGIHVIHPITEQKIPVWTANFVLMDYGSGAVMSVPAHDQRDWEFASTYNLPIQPVIKSLDLEAPEHDYSMGAYTEKGLLYHSETFNNLTSEAAFEAIANALSSKGLAEIQTHYRLRDWGVSRQRYWGTPIPMIECSDCGTVPVPEADLPVILPTDSSPAKRAELETPISLKKMPSFYETTCPKCGKQATRETDTFDTFMESSWYYARFCARDDNTQMLNREASQWLPVDHYVGGIEHAVLHLLYARFFHKLMCDLGLITAAQQSKADTFYREPFQKLLCQGMVVADTFYQIDDSGKKHYFFHHEVNLQLDDKGRAISATLKKDQSPVVMGGIEKMSKSKNNGVDPKQLIEQYGADTVRLFILFAAPPEQSLEWSDAGVEGAHRFLKRLWRFAQSVMSDSSAPPTNLKSISIESLSTQQADLHRKTHQTLQKVTDDIARRLTFNTAIAAVMELLNHLQKFKQSAECASSPSSQKSIDHSLLRQGLEIIIQTLAPMTPHLCHYLWQQLEHPTPIHQQPWPAVDHTALVVTQITWVIQVNSKVRLKLNFPANTPESQITEKAQQHEKIQKFIQEKFIVKTIVIPNKLVNFVVK